MRRLSILRKAFKRLDGFSFGMEPIKLSDDVYYALVEADQSLADYSVDMVALNLLNRLITLFKTCAMNEDVYRRVGGGKSFWFFIAAAWNPLHPLTPEEIEQLVMFMLGSRHRYISESARNAFTNLTNAADSLINIVDDADSRYSHQPVKSLRTPAAASHQEASVPGSPVWPPVHFSSMDVAMMAIKGVREKISGVSSTNQGQAVALPKCLDEPLAVRTYLSQLALSRMKPDANLALYLAPVAFADHLQRQAWYKTTGHKSRLYGTAPEFVEYARRALFGRNPREQAVCLLTPWFFEPADAARVAQETDRPIPTAWLRSCPRAGMVLVLSKTEEKKGKGKGKLGCRALLFQPGPPRYADAAEPMPERRARQGAWLDAIFDVVDAEFTVHEGYTGGSTLRRYENGQPSPDSVELACQFVRELVEEPEKGVPEGCDLAERGFALVERWDDEIIVKSYNED
ncbi:hypothetical protein DL771_000560 [Monosporascus sp. 5C6A]|nr:hypothetical protein DL771_000560 [Monosporascus sp. 5C6A]